MKNKFFAVAIFLVGSVIGGMGVWVLKTPDTSTPLSVESASERLISPQLIGDTETVLYINNRFGFSLQYPPAFEVREFDEVGNSMTVVFQRPGVLEGFQIFITPYEEDTITESRIKADIPSGVINNPQEVIIGDNVRALHFTSVAPVIGASSETWFIHDGHLYEVTAYIDLDAEMANILSTLNFE